MSAADPTRSLNDRIAMIKQEIQNVRFERLNARVEADETHEPALRTLSALEHKLKTTRKRTYSSMAQVYKEAFSTSTPFVQRKQLELLKLLHLNMVIENLIRRTDRETVWLKNYMIIEIQVLQGEKADIVEEFEKLKDKILVGTKVEQGRFERVVDLQKECLFILKKMNGEEEPPSNNKGIVGTVTKDSSRSRMFASFRNSFRRSNRETSDSKRSINDDNSGKSFRSALSKPTDSSGGKNSTSESFATELPTEESVEKETTDVNGVPERPSL